MKPAEIVRRAKSDGVNLALSETGNIRVTGDDSAISKWTATIKASKPEIVAYLANEEAKVRRWLDRIGEDDPVTINEIIGAIRSNPEARSYFLERATND